MHSINAAAVEAYGLLQTLYPGVPIGVIGESLGSGPASYLCSLPDAPSRAVLIVPFDNLLSVAKEHIHFLPVSLLMRDKWDNVAALARYAGRVDIYGAAQDTVIPVHHARQLAQALPRATYHEVDCGHNDWSSRGLVKIAE
jgi:pimeloyl-ACP methyl ester carboxylesterase